MSFARIGPYELTRGDMIAASLVISFSTGARAVRVKCFLLLGCGLLISAAGVLMQELTTAGLGLLFILLIFVIGPALRSRKGSEDIYLDYAHDGLVAETPNVRTTYKWNTIRTVNKVGPRLFVMITDGCALVISERWTSARNMADLIDTIARHRAKTSS